MVSLVSPSAMSKASTLDIETIRQDFPALAQQVNDKPLVYLDNGATTLKPRSVIETMSRFMAEDYATVRRGVYNLSAKATQRFDHVREQLAEFIGARNTREIVFVKGTTEAINLVAHSFARPRLQPGDEILISALEHHANIVPWQQVANERQAVIKVIPVLDNGELDQEAYRSLLSAKTRLVAITHVSNALGTINPIKQMIAEAHARGIPVFVDGAQSAPHMPVNVQDLDCDFYAFSAHKLYGPTGIGVLYGKYDHLLEMPPFQTGGDMIETVTFEKTTFQKPPHRFEPGTPAIIEVIGLGAAIDYLQSISMAAIEAYEAELLAYATEKLSTIEGLKIVGTAPNKASLVSFVFDDIHPHDVGTLLDHHGVAVRAGHHCAQPVMTRFGVPATTRASFAFYNTHAEIDTLAESLNNVLQVFR